MNRVGRLSKKGSQGFTLVELMVVVGILAVLMVMVFPAVTGTKSASTESQVVSDAQAVAKGMDTFQNKSIKPSFPEQALGSSLSYQLPAGSQFWKKEATSPSITVGLSNGSSAGGATAMATLFDFNGQRVPAYKEIHWSAPTDIWQPNGSVNTVTFVADFLLKKPSSVPLQNDERLRNFNGAKYLAEFLWLLKVSSPGSADESRVVEVYRLMEKTTDGFAVYKQIY